VVVRLDGRAMIRAAFLIFGGAFLIVLYVLTGPHGKKRGHH
jgi:hypothetical protein